MCVFSHAFFGSFQLIVSTGDKINVTIICGSFHRASYNIS